MSIVFFILHLALATGLIASFSALQLKGFRPIFSAVFFSLKGILIALAFGYFSETPQPGDAESYLHDADLLFQMFRDDPAAAWNYISGEETLPAGYIHTEFNLWDATVYHPFLNDNKSVILLNLLLRFVSFGYSPVHLVWMAFAGWMGLVFISRALFHSQHANAQWLAPFFVPQVLIWNSLVLKEPLLLFSLGLLIWGCSEWLHGKAGWKKMLWSLAGFAIVKTFLLVLLVPALLGFMIAVRFKFRPLPVFMFSFAGCIVLLVILSRQIESLHLPSVLFGQQLSMYRFVVFSHANSILKPLLFAPDWLSMLRRIPDSLAYALLQPLPWVYHFKMAWPVFIENVLVVAYFLYALLMNGKMVWNHPLRLFLLFGGLTICSVAAFVSPVAGTLVRYKMPGVLLMLCAVIPFAKKSRRKQRVDE